MKNDDVLCCSINKYKDASFGYFVNNNRDTVNKLKEGISTFEGCYKEMMEVVEEVSMTCLDGDTFVGINAFETSSSQLFIWKLIGINEVFPLKALSFLFNTSTMIDMYMICKEMVENQKRFMKHKAKYGKRIYEELIPIAWHPDRAYGWCFDEEHKGDIESLSRV